MIIHRFWMGRRMPEEYRAYGRKWLDLNPGSSLCEWGEDILPYFPAMAPIFTDLYERDDARRGVELSVQIADVMGYCLVERFGGIYVNCDMEPVRPIGMRLPDTAWASFENTVDGRINNAAIGAPTAHDLFWNHLLELLPQNYWAHRYDEMVMATGPGYLTNFAAASGDLPFTTLPMTVFNSVHWKTIRPGGNASNLVAEQRYPDDAIAVHHWGHKKDGRTNTVESATQVTWR